MFKCKRDFLWFKEGQVVEDIQDNWKPHFDVMSEKEPVVEEPVAVVEDKLEFNVVEEEPKKESFFKAKKPVKKGRK